MEWTPEQAKWTLTHIFFANLDCSPAGIISSPNDTFQSELEFVWRRLLDVIRTHPDFLVEHKEMYDILVSHIPIRFLGHGENGVVFELENVIHAKKQTNEVPKVIKFNVCNSIQTEYNQQHEFARAGLSPDVYGWFGPFQVINNQTARLWITVMQKVEGTIESWVNRQIYGRVDGEIESMMKAIFKLFDDTAAEGWTHGDGHPGNIGYVGSTPVKREQLMWIDFGFATTRFSDRNIDLLRFLSHTWPHREFPKRRSSPYWKGLIRKMLQDEIIRRGTITTNRRALTSEASVDKLLKTYDDAYKACRNTPTCTSVAISRLPLTPSAPIGKKRVLRGTRSKKQMLSGTRSKKRRGKINRRPSLTSRQSGRGSGTTRKLRPRRKN